MILASIMSGVALGCNLCFYTDPVFMTSASTGVSNLRIIKTALPYSLSAALLSAIALPSNRIADDIKFLSLHLFFDKFQI